MKDFRLNFYYYFTSEGLYNILIHYIYHTYQTYLKIVLGGDTLSFQRRHLRFEINNLKMCALLKIGNNSS